jgi:hypothetical protein
MFPKHPSTECNQLMQATLEVLREESNDLYPAFKESLVVWEG